MNIFKSLMLSHPVSVLLRCVSRFLDKSTEDEEEELTSGNILPGNDKCILSTAVYDKKLIQCYYTVIKSVFTSVLIYNAMFA